MPIGTNRGDWSKLEAHRVADGVEMTFEEIANVAEVSKQRIEQVYQVALRKFQRRAVVARLKEVVR